MIMKKLTMEGFLLISLVVVVQIFQSASATCINVANNELLEFNCNGGTADDIESIPEKAEKIKIQGMRMPRITSDTFARFGEHLFVLMCSNCEIREIDDNAFRKLVNLQQLTLNSNELTTVKAAWFQDLDYLTYLDLNYNQINSVEDGVFKRLPNLVDFRIAGNRLECLNVEAMTQLSELKRIYVNDNREFKCPNALVKFLDSRKIDYEKDPDWSRIPYDLVSASRFAGYEEEPKRPPPVVHWSTTERRYDDPSRPIPTVGSIVSSTDDYYYTSEDYGTTSSPYYPEQRQPSTTYRSSWPSSNNNFQPQQTTDVNNNNYSPIGDKYTDYDTNVPPVIPKEDAYQGPYYAPEAKRQFDDYKEDGNSMEPVEATTECNGAVDGKHAVGLTVSLMMMVFALYFK